MTTNTLPIVTSPILAESIERSTARHELRQLRKWPEYREEDAERELRAVRAGIRPSEVYEIAGYPTRREISVWRQVNPEFDAEFKAALEDRADELVAEGLEVVRDKERDPSCRKVEADYAWRLAGALSERYRGKGAGDVTNVQVNVAGDVNVSPADAYLSMIGG